MKKITIVQITGNNIKTNDNECEWTDDYIFIDRGKEGIIIPWSSVERVVVRKFENELEVE